MGVRIFFCYIGTMIALRNLSRERTDEIAAVFAEAFCSEDGALSRAMDEKTALLYFRETVRVYSRYGLLYALNEKEEGYCVWHHKDHGLPWYMDLYILYRYMRVLPARTMQKMIIDRQGWDDYTVVHMKDADYVDVSLVAIKKEYRGRGLLRALLAAPFAEADACGIPCILDTDSPLKAAKYEHIGMHAERHAVLASGLRMYTMIYYPSA